MVPTCGVCAANDSKYKCPVCELRYCSIPCYKSHKTTHEKDEGVTETRINDGQPQAPNRDRPGTKQRVPKVEFTGFEDDPEFQRLLLRFPKLKKQLQLAYGLTLEPGPDEAGTWNRRDWMPGAQENIRADFRERGRGRGRGRSRGRGRGHGRGGFSAPEIPPEDRPRGPWTQEKGDKQGINIVHRMRQGTDAELADGMDEFVQLCQIKFGRAE